MRKIFLFVFLLIVGLPIFAQVPHAINYQAVAYDEAGKVLGNQEISIKIDILQGSTQGAIVYSEIHQATTASNGVLNLLIGEGESNGSSFDTINWSLSPFYIRLSMDANGGSDYKEMAVSQILSVPYAFYAEKAGKIEEEIPKFQVTPRDGPSSKLLTGSNAEFTGFAIYLFVNYLDVPDQEAQYEVTGLPDGVYMKYPYDDESEDSGPLGRSISLEVHEDSDCVPGEYNCVLRIWNKYGYTKEYPFVYKIYPPFIPEIQDSSIPEEEKDTVVGN